jgi:hypothetical protein
MTDYEYDELPRRAARPPLAKPKRRRRPLVTISGFTLLRLAQVAMVTAVTWGLVLGEQWLWALVHHG